MAFEENMGLIIESRKIFNSLKSIFEMSWNLLDGSAPKTSDNEENDEKRSDVIFNKDFLEGR